MSALSFEDRDRPASLVNAMARYIGMFDVVRDGPVAPLPAEIPADAIDRANHLKAAGYYFDASMVGVCALPHEAMLAAPIRNPIVETIAAELESSQPRSFAAGMDMILADVLDSARRKPEPIGHHTHALVFLVEYPRDPGPDEPGCEWIVGTQAHRAAVLSAQTAVLLATYLRMLGFEARSHTATCSDVDLGRLAVAAGLARVVGDSGAPALDNPYVGRRFGLAAVTTTLAMAADAPLAEPGPAQRLRSHGPAWWLGKATLKGALHRDAYAHREFRLGAFPFETLAARRGADHVHRSRTRAALSETRRLLCAGAVRRHGQGHAGAGQERPLRDEEPDRRLRPARARGAAAAAVRRRARAGVAGHAGPAAQRRQPEGDLVLPELRRGRAVRGARVGVLLARCRRQPDGGVPPQRRQHADRPGSRDHGGRQRRRLDLGRAEHARVPALLDAGRHRRRADPPPGLLGAGALGDRRRRAAAAAAAAVGPGRGQPHRRGDPEPVPGPAPEVRDRDHRHADGVRPADRLRAAALLRAVQQVRARVPVRRDHRGPQADVQRLRDLEVRRREMCALPDRQPGRRHVRALHEDLPVEPRRAVRRERLSLACNELPGLRARAGRARRPARARLDQPGQEVVVGHRARPRAPGSTCARRRSTRAA